MNRNLWWCLAGVLVAVGAARGQMQPDPMTDAKPPAEAPDDPMALSGPKVPDEVAHTLVTFNARGQFVRVDGRPEVAGLALLRLEPEKRDRAAEVVAERGRAIKELLLDNLDLIREATDSLAAGDAAKVEALSKALYEKFDPAEQRDPLMAGLAGVLSGDEAADLARLVEDYWGAWIDWELRNSKDKSGEARDRVRRRLTLRLFQDEVRQGYERSLRPYRDRFETMNTALKFSDEQKSRVRGLLIEFIRESRLEPSDEQRAELAREIYGVLDESQRVKALEMLMGRL